MDLPHERKIVALIVVVFVILAVGFSSGPILEAPDEINHYVYARYLGQTHTLPDIPNMGAGEYHQPPLYYALIAPLTAVAGESDFAFGESRNNQYTYVLALGGLNIPGNDNKNFYLHTSAETFPYKSTTARAIHLARLLSILMGAGTVIASYAVFRVLWPDRPNRRLLAVGVVAFWPQFIYVSGVLNNDNLLNFLATVSLWLILRQHQGGASWKNATLVGLVLGAALLTKISAAFLVLPVGVAVLLDARRMWRYAIITLIVVFAIAGWWYIRNAVLYHDPFLSRTVAQLYHWAAINGGRWTWDSAIANIPQAYERLWARFGWLDVTVGAPNYRVFDALVILGLGGLVFGLINVIRCGDWQGSGRVSLYPAIVVGVFVMTWVVFLFYSSGRAIFGNQGRYLLPGIAGWAAIIALGLDTFTPRRLRLPAAVGSIVLLAAVAAICLFGYFLPAYRPSPLPDRIEHPLSLRFEDAAELIGVQSDVVHTRPGEALHITLYWRAIQPTDVNLTAFVHSVGSNTVYRDSYPATGNLLSTDWLPGQTWAEKYIVIIPQDAEEQVAYPLMAGLYETDTQRALAATDSEGKEVTSFVGQIVINGPAQPFDPDYRFGDVIGLAQPKITRDGDALKVCLRWGSLAPTSTDYHVFIHVLSAGGDLITQSDFQPKNGSYPTSVWTAGEVINDCATLDAAQLPDQWEVAIGLYEFPSGERLPVVDREGHLLDNGMVVITPQ